MIQNKTPDFSRRRFLKTAGATALAATGPAIIIPGRAQPKTLKILEDYEWGEKEGQWYDEYVKKWGERNATRVIVDRVKQHELPVSAAAEAKARQGHDLIRLYWAPGVFETSVIDHREIYQECEKRYGNAHDFAIRGSYNPRSKKYFSFAGRYYPQPVLYRKDLWEAVGRAPDSWDDIRRGGRHIKLLHERPVGIGLSTPNPDSEAAMRAILYSFGASEQDEDGRPALKSAATLEALKFVKSLFEEAMTEEVLSWDNISNNRAMLAGDISLTINPITATRSGEHKNLRMTDDIWVAAAPAGPVAGLAPINPFEHHIIWQFADNIDGAKQFLVDYTVHSREACFAGEFTALPSFPDTVPDMEQLLSNDSKAHPPDKYKILASAAQWSTNIGHPGYDNPAISAIFDAGLIPTMFAAVATGKMTADEAMIQADQEVRKIYQKWQDLGKV